MMAYRGPTWAGASCLLAQERTEESPLFVFLAGSFIKASIIQQNCSKNTVKGTVRPDQISLRVVHLDRPCLGQQLLYVLIFLFNFEFIVYAQSSEKSLLTLNFRRTACMCASRPLFQQTGLQKRRNHAFYVIRSVWGIPKKQFGSRLNQHPAWIFHRLILRQLYNRHKGLYPSRPPKN